MAAACVSMTCRLRAAERVCYPTYTGGEAAAQCSVDMHTDGRGSDTHSKGRDGDTHMDHRRLELRRRVSPPARDLRPPSLTWMGRRDSCRHPFATFRCGLPSLPRRHSHCHHGTSQVSPSAHSAMPLHTENFRSCRWRSCVVHLDSCHTQVQGLLRACLRSYLTL
ncbi:hypothetical protein E2C01_078533 [Portunus trituberculatus]|uniref:Uncharacterized protein n=1 Tax=Portunus trituberculatus TaxID=210409 RepID=A0A5B7IUD3_PORTR|nr:hypothetical protein [Portunus trituberculatus]